MRGTGRTVLLVVLDGAADRPASELDGRTPLEAAETPQLDRLASAGVSGLVDVSRPGLPLSSDRAHTILFGYAPEEVPGRGVLEARGFGLSVPENGCACSASFARIDADGDGWTITDRKVKSARDDCAQAAARVESFEHRGVDLAFSYTWKNRGIVTLESERELSAAITDVDPFEAGLPIVRPESLDEAADPEAAGRTADALAGYTRFSTDRLSEMPVDVVLTKWTAERTSPPPFESRHGMSACMLTPKPVLGGLGRTLGMAVDNIDGSYSKRVNRALNELETEAFVHLHFPEPDEVAHAHSPSAKRDELEAIDAALEPLANRALSDPDLVVAVTADHTTPSDGNVVHSGEPVPLVVCGETVRTDAIKTIGERPASRGGLGRLRGHDLVYVLRANADRMLLDGLRRAPEVPDHPKTDLRSLEREP
jgi:2,3-bisphosphoglycerate-independent phosphoglycerate mutase